MKPSKRGISFHFRREARFMAAMPLAVLALALPMSLLGPVLLNYFAP